MKFNQTNKQNQRISRIAETTLVIGTDIAAAFEAEEIAIEKDPAMYVHALASVVFGYNQVQDISDIKKLCLLIHATPEQRCKAALLAVMGE